MDADADKKAVKGDILKDFFPWHLNAESCTRIDFALEYIGG